MIAGEIESRIAQVFAATRDRGLSVAALADAAFELAGATATRAQRLSATRARHRLIRRMKEANERARRLIDEAEAEDRRRQVLSSRARGDRGLRQSHEACRLQ
jgi:hypothetical protein